MSQNALLHEIDVEVRKIIDDAIEEVRSILVVRAAALEAVAQRLIEKEVIDGTELRALIEAHDPGPKLVPGTLNVESRTSGIEDEEPEVQEKRWAEGGEG